MTTSYRRIRNFASAFVSRDNVVPMRAYASYTDALSDSDSYQDPRIIDTVAEKTRRYRETLASSDGRVIESRQTVQNMFVLSQVQALRKLNVLEIGGACGASYYETKHLMPDRIQHWSIVETAAMVGAARALSNDPALSFHTDIESALEPLVLCDLAAVQGTLQYVPEPLQLLDSLFHRNISHVYVTRTSVTNLSALIFTKQETALGAHGPGKLPNGPYGDSSQPMTLLTRDSLFSTVPSGYEIVFQFVESEERTLHIDDRAVAVRDVGFLARKRLYSHT